MQEARTAQGTALLRQKQLGQLCHQYQRRYKTGASCLLEGAKGGDRERSGWKEGVCNGSKIRWLVVPLSQDCDFCSLEQGVSSPALLTLLLWPRGTCYVGLFPGGQQDADSHPSWPFLNLSVLLTSCIFYTENQRGLFGRASGFAQHTFLLILIRSKEWYPTNVRNNEQTPFYTAVTLLYKTSTVDKSPNQECWPWLDGFSRASFIEYQTVVKPEMGVW